MMDIEERREASEGGPMELGHEAWPGYRRAFYVVFGLGLLYLVMIFLFGGR